MSISVRGNSVVRGFGRIPRTTNKKQVRGNSVNKFHEPVRGKLAEWFYEQFAEKY